MGTGWSTVPTRVGYQEKCEINNTPTLIDVAGQTLGSSARLTRLSPGEPLLATKDFFIQSQKLTSKPCGSFFTLV